MPRRKALRATPAALRAVGVNDANDRTLVPAVTECDNGFVVIFKAMQKACTRTT
jgi:hypothetical protein